MDGDNGVIAGHGRLMSARKLGMDAVPVIELAHLSPTQRKAYVLADNQLSTLSGRDDQLLHLELAELNDLGFDLDLIGFSDGELDRLLNRKLPQIGDRSKLEFSGTLPSGGSDENIAIYRISDSFGSQRGRRRYEGVGDLS